MKNFTIISGPKASGKSWIAAAIAKTHRNVIRTRPQELFKRIEEGELVNLTDQYSLMIVDDCSVDDIAALELLIRHIDSVDIWTLKPRFNKDCCISHIPTVFITQEDVSAKTHKLFSDFHIINCVRQLFK